MLLAVVATKFTSQFVLKFAANNYFVYNISLDISCPLLFYAIKDAFYNALPPSVIDQII